MENSRRDLSRWSLDIAKYGSQSTEDHWRAQLMTGSLVDAFDSTKIWYASTVTGTTERNNENNEPVPFVRIGFRIYHPEGNKEDDEKNRFFGWSERFDEWIPAYSARLQPYETFAKKWDQSGLVTTTNEDIFTVDDSMDLLLYNRQRKGEIFAIERKKCKSTLMTRFLNRFGELGGFAKMKQAIEDPEVAIDTAYYYLDCIHRSSFLFHRIYVNAEFESLAETASRKLLSINEQQIRNIKKERVDAYIKCIEVIISRLKGTDPRRRYIGKLSLELALIFLKQTFLERRIDGAKLI